MVAEAILCLAMNIYYEARGESFIGQVAVAEVVMNRVRKHEWANTPCDVVMQPHQFSWTTGYKPHAVDLRPYIKAAKTALTSNYTHGADHYHTIGIIPPDWSDHMEVVNVIGNHIFYRRYYD